MIELVEITTVVSTGSTTRPPVEITTVVSTGSTTRPPVEITTVVSTGSTTRPPVEITTVVSTGSTTRAVSVPEDPVDHLAGPASHAEVVIDQLVGLPGFVALDVRDGGTFTGVARQ